MLAAPHSGSGKTTVAALVCLALRNRGLKVAPFKLGPDYLDPTHLARAAGQPTRNLDSFLLSPERIKALFARSAAQADISVLEGMMGLYDGRDPASDDHSSADLARLLEAPVVLVIDASGSARTVAAVARGLRDFGPDLKIAGVILNRVGSPAHAALCEVALDQIGLPCLGFVCEDAALMLPARHLGLLSAEQASWEPEAALKAAAHLRLDSLLAAAQAPALPLPPLTVAASAPGTSGRRATIAYALDEAFHFYYPDSLDALREAGATLLPFSPLRDTALPAGVGGVLLGGGYPEVHAAALSANASMRRAIREFAASGRPVIGECGGLMYLAESLEDAEGRVTEMCGVVPYRTRMAARLTLGYRAATALRTSPLTEAGTQLRGHEFHHSVLTHPPTRPAFSWTGPDGHRTEEGYAHGQILASYLHLHFGADPAVAARLVSACLGGAP